MIRLVVSCDHDGCTRTMTVELADDCYVTGGRSVTVDGITADAPEAGWSDNGGAYYGREGLVAGEPPRRDFCPDHASEAGA